MDTRQLTISESATRLCVSTRTSKRRIRVGALTETQRDGVRYVVLTNVPAQPYIETPTAESRDRTDQDTETRMSELWDRLQATEADRDHWRHQAETLSRNISELTATLYRLGEQKALPTSTASRQHRAWLALLRAIGISPCLR